MDSLLILYGSQTGNAEEISRTIFSHLKAKYIGCKMESMKEFVKNTGFENFSKVNVVVFVLSTTGKGDPPDNARKFMRLFNKNTKKNKNWLRECRRTSIKYSILGLGDTNYNDFCNTAQRLDTMMQLSGCQSFHRTGLADDGTGLAAVVEPWIRDLKLELDKLLTERKRCHTDLTLPSEGKEFKRFKITNKSDILNANIQSRENSDNIKMVDQPSSNTITSRITHFPKLPKYQRSKLCLTYAKEDDKQFEQKTSYFVQRWMNVETERELKGYTPEAPFMATVLSARFLTQPSIQNRQVIHMDIALPEDAKESVIYVPGDAIGVYCPNDANTVTQLLKRLKLCGDTKIVGISDTSQLTHIIYPCTIADVFHYCVDITSAPRKSFLRMLAEWCTDENEQQKLYQLCSLSCVALTKMHLTFLELLEQFPSCHPDLSDILPRLQSLKPRYYSIACYQITNPTELQIAFTLVNYTTPKPNCRPRKGLCTHWLYKVCQEGGFLPKDKNQSGLDESKSLSTLPLHSRSGSSVTEPSCLGAWKSCRKISIPIFLRRSNDFCSPTDISKPTIMIGPGTGISPFRGFLQQRSSEKENIQSGGSGVGWWRGLEVSNKDEKKEKNPRMIEQEEEEEKVGDMILFFGCRHPEIDFLYRDELENFVDMNITELHTAFSRLYSQKVYVQHKMLEQGPRLAKFILQEQAQVFVCGDGKKMAHDVMQCVEDILHQYGNLTTANAKQYVVDMIKNKRYIADIWS